jgi:transposase InsO family protein
VVIQTGLRQITLEAAHDSLVGGGHQGVSHTHAKIIEKWWWPRAYVDTKHWIASCTTCGRAHKSKLRLSGPLNPIVVHEPFELVVMDVLGPFHTTAKGNRFVLVITDHLSKWVTAIPMATTTSVAVAEALIERICLIHGMPRRIITDQGSNFNSEMITALYSALHIAKSTTTAYHPQGNGLTERYNDTLCSVIAKIMDEHPLDWDEVLGQATFAYNTSMHALTKLSPYYILYGREPRTPAEFLIGHVDYPALTNTNTYVQQLVSRVTEATAIA